MPNEINELTKLYKELCVLLRYNDNHSKGNVNFNIVRFYTKIQFQSRNINMLNCYFIKYIVEDICYLPPLIS